MGNKQKVKKSKKSGVSEDNLTLNDILKLDGTKVSFLA